ncbi:MAG: lysostaphin resistance A-like protein, partial [Halobaculum sp.]
LGLAALGVVGLNVGISGRILVLFVFGQYLPFIGFPLLYFRRGRRMSWSEIRAYLGVRVPSLIEFGLVLGGLISLFLLVSGMAYLVTQILGLQPASNNAGRVAQSNPGIIPLFVVGSLLVIGPCEETLFRGTVQNRIREALSARVAITLSALLFASIHVTALTGPLGARATTIVILLVPSFVFGAIYEYTENLVVPALIHGLWNALLFASIWVTMQADLPSGAGALLPL